MSANNSNRLTLIGKGSRSAKYSTYRCECGVVKEILRQSVTRNHTRSCGCLNREVTQKREVIHGHARVKQATATYKAFHLMRRRCADPTRNHFERYGGRGIRVCERWTGPHGFQNFLSDMGEKPANSSIDRINNDGNYEPSNCRWATRKEQMRNRSNCHMITHGGKTMCLAAWAEELGICQSALKQRIKRKKRKGESEAAAIY